MKNFSSTDSLPVKQDYKKEIALPSDLPLRKGDSGDSVYRLQEWLIYWQLSENRVRDVIALDGVFGDNTEAALKFIQGELGLSVTGVLTPDDWNAIISPMVNAFSLESYGKTSISDRVVFFARNHLRVRACEFKAKNLGQWVRSYMGGHDGELEYWCCGFACTILDLAFSSMGKKFTDYYLNTVTVEDMRVYARKKGLLVTMDELKSGQVKPHPGDLVLFIADGGKGRAHHIAICEDILDSNGNIFVIGGNTNFGGSRDGTGVFIVHNNYMHDSIEVVKLKD